MPQLQAPVGRPYPFAYFLTIDNQSAETVTITARKWLVRDDQTGAIEVMEGDGVVGEKPRLGPGQAFSYNSYHVCRGPAAVTGAFFGENEVGEKIVVRIPEFRLTPPDSDPDDCPF